MRFSRAMTRWPALGLLFATLLSGGCEGLRTLTAPEPRPNPEVVLAERIAEIDRLMDLGKVRDALHLAELALIEHYESTELRDRIAQLRSIRQVWFDEAMANASAKVEAGQPRTALAILDEVDAWGDEEMIAKAHAERRRIAAAHPAIYRESEDDGP